MADEMTPTEELRAKLDELRIEHYDHENGEPLRDLSEAGADPATSWRMDGASVCAVPNKQGTFDLWIDNCTPEQAIAATVGNAQEPTDAVIGRIKRFCRDYARCLVASTVYGEHNHERIDRRALDKAESLEAKLIRELAEDIATVGVGTCQIETTESWLPAERYHRCKHCGSFFAVLNASHDIPPRMCPNCGRKIKENK